MISKQELDLLVEKYETKEFIDKDPIQFPHNYTYNKDIELAGFISAIFAYGKRTLFIKVLKELFDLMDGEPANFIMNGDFKLVEDKNIYYRFYTSKDIIFLFKQLSALYNSSNGLSELFQTNICSTDNMIRKVHKYFIKDGLEYSCGYKYMFPLGKTCTLKRTNMFLRWMVRNSDVDLGIWDFIPKSELLIPLDVHVSRVSRNMGLVQRKTNSMNTVFELTNKLKEFDASDPVKYDFAIFGKGIEESQSVRA